MPCMGPTPPSEKEVKPAYEEIVALLRTKYHVCDGPNLTLLAESRKEALKRLYDAVYGMFEQHGCECF